MEVSLDELRSLREQVAQFLQEGITTEAGNLILTAFDGNIAKQEALREAIERIGTDD